MGSVAKLVLLRKEYPRQRSSLIFLIRFAPYTVAKSEYRNRLCAGVPLGGKCSGSSGEGVRT